jgi:2-polyprenyl-6-methoxyphenol hydroxylase-like FAD-dependent oxidoreductase
MVLKVAIIRAGPSGLVLAQLLLPYSDTLHTTVFERDEGPNPRSQGGTLDLHEHTGLAALKEAGLYAEFLKVARFESQSFQVADKKLKRYISLGGETSRGKPEIDRGQLRKILIESLPDGMIRWNHRLVRVDEGLNLLFDNRLYKFDMIVGADGAWSKVRPFLSKHQPSFTGFSGYKFTISSVEERYSDLHKLVNRGSFFAFSDKRLLMAQYMGDNSLDVAEWALKDEAWRDAQEGNIKAVKAMIAKEYHDCAPELVKLILNVNITISSTLRSSCCLLAVIYLSESYPTPGFPPFTCTTPLSGI